MNFLFLIGVIISYGIVTFYEMVLCKKKVDETWRQVEIQLKRRVDSLAHLIEIIKTIDTEEKNIFDDATRLINNYLRAQTPVAIIKVNQQISTALKNLLAVAENSSDLQTSITFINLYQEISRIEDKISHARETYNETIKKYNSSLTMFPNKFFAQPFGFYQLRYFRTEDSERSTTKIEL